MTTLTFKSGRRAGESLETPYENAEAIELLARQDGLGEFAQSLLQQYADRGYLSDKQWPWIHALLIEKLNPPTPMVIPLGGDWIERALTAAREHLERPKICFWFEGGWEVRFGYSPRGANVVTVRVDRGERTRTFLGQITAGVFTTARGVRRVDDWIVSLMLSFTAGGATFAGQHGLLTGRCCFCGMKLTDERSTTVGYGPVCARHYRLPWGSR